jgi:hypothetical protein
MGKKTIIPSPLLDYKLRLAIRHLRRSARGDLQRLGMITKITKGVKDDTIHKIVRREVKEMRALADYLEHIVKRMEVADDKKIPLPTPYR